jgi:hypothetical protein
MARAEHLTHSDPHYYLPICTACHYNRVPPARAKLGYASCIPCGEKLAKQVRHTIAPMNKSNYILITDPSILKQLNPKR